MTVSTFARAAGLSRSTVLYYESVGLLRSVKRTQGNYRIYGEQDLRRLQQICSYRLAGLTLTDIRTILNQSASDFTAVLENRLASVTAEIERLREHQRSIARLLRNSGLLKWKTMLTKEKWTEIMQNSGFSQDDMHRWHAQFENSAPEEHEQFLRFLRISASEIASIREWSRTHAGS